MHVRLYPAGMMYSIFRFCNIINGDQRWSKLMSDTFCLLYLVLFKVNKILDTMVFVWGLIYFDTGL